MLLCATPCIILHTLSQIETCELFEQTSQKLLDIQSLDGFDLLRFEDTATTLWMLRGGSWWMTGSKILHLNIVTQ